MVEVDDLDLRHLQVAQLLHVVGQELLTGPVQAAVVAMDRPREDLADQLRLGLRFARHPQRRAPVEQVDDRFAAVESQRAQEHRGQEALLSVDFGVDQLLLLVDLELQPRAAVRDDPGRVHAFFVREDRARGAVDLTDHDPLSAVDDEGPPLGHERDVPHVDLLLTNLAGLQEYQVDLGFDRDREGQPLGLASALRELDVLLVERIAGVLQHHVSVRTLDRKYVAEHFLEPLPLRCLAGAKPLTLQQALIGRDLDVDKVGHGHHVV